MSRLTPDEAIKHCLEVAEENDLAAGTYKLLAENNHNAYEKLTAETNSSRCAECAADNRQLAEWLMDYKVLKAEMTNLRLYVQMLEEYREKAKRLLKLAVEDLNCTNDCVVCTYVKDNNCPDDRENCGFEWRHANEALALIGEESE